MAYIEIIDPAAAEGELKGIYEELKRGRGKIAQVHSIQSLNPPTISAHMELYKKVMFGRSPLSRAQREMMAVVVSKTNGCDYCIAHHREALDHFWKDKERSDLLIKAAEKGETASDFFTDGNTPFDLPRLGITQFERALCVFAQGVTRFPASESDGSAVALLRNASDGTTDRHVLDATLVVAYFNFVNRIVLTLGVDLESDPGGYKYDEE